MAKKIFLHIGLNGIGSSTLPASLARNRAPLREQGVLFLQSFKRGVPALSQLLRRTNTPRFQPNYEKIRQLREEINQASEEIVAISCEELAAANANQVKKLRSALGKGHAYTILFFIQRQERWLESLWSQLVMLGLVSDPFPVFVEQAVSQKFANDRYAAILRAYTNPDFHQRLQPWVEVFGQENIQMHVLEDPLDEGEVFWKYLAAMGIENQEAFKLVQKDSAPDAKTSELIRSVVHAMGLKKNRKNLSLMQYIAQTVHSYAKSQGWGDEHASQITGQLSETLSESFAQTNSQLAQSCLGRDQLFLQPFVPQPGSAITLEEMDSQELLKLSAFLVDHLLNSPQFARLLINKHTLENLDTPWFEEMKETAADLAAENQTLEKEYEEMINSRGWKALNSLRRLYQPVYQLFHRSEK